MRNYLVGSIFLLAVMLAFSTVASAQTGQEQGGQPATANQNRERNRANTPSATANLPFDPRDFSGVWRFEQQTSSHDAVGPSQI
jgi:hypothetical protein